MANWFHGRVAVVADFPDQGSTLAREMSGNSPKLIPAGTDLTHNALEIGHYHHHFIKVLKHKFYS